MGKLMSLLKILKQDGVPARYVMILVVSCAMLFLYILRLNINIVIVSMVNFTAIPHVNLSLATSECQDDNVTDQHAAVSEDGEFAWDEQMQSLVTGAFFWSSLITQFVGGRVAEVFGTKYMFAGAQVGSIVITCLLPILARLGVYFFIAGRVLLGLCQGVCMPSIQPLLAKWTPVTERSIMSSLIISTGQLGTIVGIPVSGLIASEISWEAVFYIEGALAAVIVPFSLFYVYDSPAKHPRISASEREFIEKSTVQGRLKPTSIPWKEILRSGPVWAILASSIGSRWGYYVLLNEIPIYMKTMLHFDIKSNALLTALPYIVTWVLNIVVAQLADLAIRRGWATISFIRKTANTIGLVGPAICLLLVCTIGCQRIATIVLLTLAVGFQGAYSSGYMVNQLDIAPNFAGTIYGITSGCASLASWVAPFIVSTLIKGQQTLNQWRIAFYMTSGIWVLAALIFIVFGSTEIQTWNNVTETQTTANEPATNVEPTNPVECNNQEIDVEKQSFHDTQNRTS